MNIDQPSSAPQAIDQNNEYTIELCDFTVLFCHLYETNFKIPLGILGALSRGPRNVDSIAFASLLQRTTVVEIQKQKHTEWGHCKGVDIQLNVLKAQHRPYTP